MQDFLKPPIHYMDTTVNNQPNQFVTEMPMERSGFQQTPLQPPPLTRIASTAVPSGKKRENTPFIKSLKDVDKGANTESEITEDYDDDFRS